MKTCNKCGKSIKPFQEYIKRKDGGFECMDCVRSGMKVTNEKRECEEQEIPIEVKNNKILKQMASDIGTIKKWVQFWSIISIIAAVLFLLFMK